MNNCTITAVNTILNYFYCLFVCVEVLRPSQPMGSCPAQSVYLTTLLLGRLSPLSVHTVQVFAKVISFALHDKKFCSLARNKREMSVGLAWVLREA